jgi:uncharacterized Zn-binding protein involved in type VI secretion
MRGPSARITDAHVCPAHGGGVLVVGMPTVIVGKMPASRIGDLGVCGPIPNVVAAGETTVLIGKLPAARLGDAMAHGGKIATGFPTVWIGNKTPPPMSAQAQAFLAAALSRAPLVEECTA